MAFLADGGMVVGCGDGTGVVRLLGRKPSFLWELSWTWAEGIVCYFETVMTTGVKIDISACQDKAVCLVHRGQSCQKKYLDCTSLVRLQRYVVAMICFYQFPTISITTTVNNFTQLCPGMLQDL